MSMIDIVMDQVLSSLNMRREEIEPMVKDLAEKVAAFDGKLDTIIENQTAILELLKNAQGIGTTEPRSEPERGE